jgi:glycyl-tRNA synthetase beta chain
MVGEFPELQGIMGRVYAAKVDKEPAEVALAIEEHYQPRGASDAVPSSPAGIAVSMADKIDTIAACFSIGLEPTGTADPYGLRRAALGIVRTTLEHGLVFSLSSLIDKAITRVGAAGERKAHVAAQIEEFFKMRLRGLLSNEARGDVIDSVLATGIDDLVAAAAKIRALATLRDNADFEPLAIAVKRVTNILKEEPSGDVDMAQFQDDAEKALWQAFLSTREQVLDKLKARAFAAAVDLLITLKVPVDLFFDRVLVMAPDLAVRRNRLALLRDLRSLFMSIADISRIQVENT